MRSEVGGTGLGPSLNRASRIRLGQGLTALFELKISIHRPRHLQSINQQATSPPESCHQLLFFTFRCVALSEKAMASHSSTLAWKIPPQRSLVGCSPWGHIESDTTE